MFTAMFKLRFTFVYSSIQLKVLPCLQIIIVWCLPYWQLCKDWSLTFFIYSALQIDIFTCTMLLSLQIHGRYNVHSSLQTERSNLAFGSFYDEIEFCLSYFSTEVYFWFCLQLCSAFYSQFKTDDYFAYARSSVQTEILPCL